MRCTPSKYSSGLIVLKRFGEESDYVVLFNLFRLGDILSIVHSSKYRFQIRYPSSVLKQLTTTATATVEGLRLRQKAPRLLPLGLVECRLSKNWRSYHSG